MEKKIRMWWFATPQLKDAFTKWHAAKGIKHMTDGIQHAVELAMAQDDQPNPEELEFIKLALEAHRRSDYDGRIALAGILRNHRR